MDDASLIKLVRVCSDAHQALAAPVMKSKTKSKQRPKTFDRVLAAVSADQRKALNKLRRDIRSAAPKAEECIAYGLPSFRLNGKFLVAIGGAAKHCAFYVGSIVQAFKKELKKYDTSKGTIRFQPDKPLPTALVRKLVKARIAQDARFR